MSLVFILCGDILSGTVKCKPVVTSKGIVFAIRDSAQAWPQGQQGV
ncbi:Uncharacterized protein ChrSV_3298 [Chromobacterium vaccinii]|nr:Uncharacterized protein ChrSW_3298 [Chromobacterium vaccinii]QND90755.1 Uncharacterized protein ChrSV_3298 [Chromobacterium vaccinii]